MTAIRGALGGVLMGLANLVPGISGGTMLLAAGVYPAFIAAIAELTTFRFRVRSIVLLGVVAGGAALAILSLAGPTRTLVIEDRWISYRDLRAKGWIGEENVDVAHQAVLA